MTLRSRRFPWLPSFLLLAVLGVLAGFFLALPVWTISQIRIEGTDYLPPELVSQAAEGARGKNSWFLNRARLRQEVMNLAPIREVKFWFLVPGTLVIRIRERTPYLLIEQGPVLAVADDAGLVIALIKDDGSAEEFITRPELFTLPLLKTKLEAASGRQLPPDLWDKLTLIITGWQKSLSGYSLIVQPAESGNFNLILADTLPVRLGRDNLGQKIEDLKAILDSEPEPLTKFSVIDLRFGENYVVKYRTYGPEMQGESSGH